MANLYTIKRDEMCVGKVITDFRIDHKSKKIESCIVYRNMLFVKDLDNTACDLLYNSPQYSIYNQNNISEIENNKIILNQAYNIGRLLRYYGYAEELTFEDVLNIRQRFFDGKFPIQNAHTFGLEAIDPSKLNYYDHLGKKITDPELLAKLIKQRKRCELFGLIPEFRNSDAFEELTPEQIEYALLPTEYFKILLSHGDNSLLDVLNGYKDKMNTFKPAKEECIVRRLKKA